MKTTLKLILITFFAISCKAQIIPMNNAYVEIPNGAYLKDTEFFLDNFIGTWEYQNGLENFTIILQKQLNYDYDNFTKDILFGEYKYTNSSGATLINTLSDINLNEDVAYRNISGATFKVAGEFPVCANCNPNEIRVKSYFDDPLRKYLSLEIIMRYISPTQIKVQLYRSGMSFFTPENVDSQDEPTVPFFEYTMNKI